MRFEIHRLSTGKVWIRKAVTGDAPAIARVHVSSWTYAYDGLLPESVIQSQTESGRTSFWSAFVADPENWPVLLLDTAEGVIGFASVIPARDDDVDQASVSELAAIYLHESAIGKGLGIELLRYCWAEARIRDYATMVLWVLEENTRALTFYRKNGFEADGTSKFAARLNATEIRLRIAIPETEIMSIKPELRKRVYLYIVRRRDVLVLKHVDFPNLGLQIPGGTVELNEAPIDAAAREALEETGLTCLGEPDFLGVTVVNSERTDEDLLEAWFYRIKVLGEVPECWFHTELFASEGDVRFELSWLPVSDAVKHLGATDCLMLDT